MGTEVKEARMKEFGEQFTEAVFAASRFAGSRTFYPTGRRPRDKREGTTWSSSPQ